MDLKLLNATLAELYEMPQSDCSSTDVLAYFRAKGWTETEAQNHLNAAVAAGAYRKIETPRTSRSRELKEREEQ